jgi:hypothetical protein
VEKNLQPMGDDAEMNSFPVLRDPKEYRPSKPSSHTMAVEDKRRFLEFYYRSGNMTKSAKAAGFHIKAFTEQMKLDMAFAEDFLAVREAIANDLEETMRLNAMTPKGYMDRITWLRANTDRYNPEKQASSGGGEMDEIKKLANKLKDYDLIPKKNIVEVKDEFNGTDAPNE